MRYRIQPTIHQSSFSNPSSTQRTDDSANSSSAAAIDDISLHPPRSNDDSFHDLCTSSYSINEASVDTMYGSNQPDMMSSNNSTNEQTSRNSSRANKPASTDFGTADNECSFCGALFWYEERCKSSSRIDFPRYNLCCRQGRISLPPLRDPPPLLASLLDPNSGPDSAHYRHHIRMYNLMFALTSMGVKIDEVINDGRGPYVFKISGQACHRMGSLLPAHGSAAKFAQLYVHDTTNEIANRMLHFPTASNRENPKPHIVAALKQMLVECNPIVQAYRTAADRILASADNNMRLRICGQRGSRSRQYSSPTIGEVVGLLVGDFNPDELDRDIIIQHQNGELERISCIHPSYMALQYPLLLPYGEDSFHKEIEYDPDAASAENIRRDYLTMAEYYRYRLHIRRHGSGIMFHCGRLFQQICVDMFACIDQSRLAYLRDNQASLRSDSLMNIKSAVLEGDMYGSEIGKLTILPATHVGSRRYLFQNYQDAIAVCRHLGLPHLFITFTCNPLWPEITRMLLPGQTPNDRFDLICRVFKMKLDELIHDIKNKKHFGTISGLIYTVEFQKRGLPHVHIIVWLSDRNSLTTPAEINNFISAELPDPSINPEGYQIVSQFMIHGPCGQSTPKAPCMEENRCSKNYPKDFRSATIISDDGFVLYRRRNTDVNVIKNGIKLNNRNVVPYNLQILLKYQAHINVERCHAALVVKYLFKYICKCHDRAFVAVERHNDSGIDEIAEYLDCRYLAPPEAVWRIFQYDIHYSWPTVERLTIHLPMENNVVFHASKKLPEIANSTALELTKLTAWFQLNQINEEARQYTYSEIPSHYTWQKNKTWTIRKRGYRLGRIYYVNPASGDLYYLRMLLNSMRGAKSFEDLRTINGRTYKTFKEACYAAGYLDDDNESLYTLQEASTTASAC